MNKEDLAEKCRLEKINCREAFDNIRSGEMSFEDFYYGWLDDLRNVDFEEGYVFAMDTVKEFINEAEGDIDYVKFLLERDSKRRSGMEDVI